MGELLNLVNIDGEFRVDSRLISQELNVEHKNTLEVIRKYEERFLRYGKVAFKTAPSLNTESCQNMTVCFLNEQQATFLVTLSRNSEKAVDLKQKLTDSYFFYKTKNQPKIPQTYAEALQLAADQAKIIEQQKPKVEFAENIERSDDTIEVGTLSNVLCKKGIEIGRNRLFKILKDKNGLNLLINTQKPYQYALDNKWFEIEEYSYTDSKGKDRVATKVLVTGKGQIYIEKRLRDYFNEKVI